MVLSPTPTQSFASPGKRKRTHEDTTPYAPKNSPSIPRNAGSLRTYPLLVAQQVCNDGPPISQTSVTGKFENLAIRGNTIQQISSLPQHDGKRLAATEVESSPMDGSMLGEFQVSSTVCQTDVRPPASRFDFDLPSSAIPEPPRRQSRSPPLDGEPHDNFWSESEITGHLGMDPDDDGIGINGVGFKPTSATAWARSQKRKQQLAEYKSRETREARQRRIERRRLPSAAESEENEETRSTKTRVRFEDG